MQDKNFDTLTVRFSEPIREIDKLFAENGQWGVSTLEDWCNNYESTRFTQIDEYSAIITSEYNMENVTEWLGRYILLSEIKQT